MSLVAAAGMGTAAMLDTPAILAVGVGVGAAWAIQAVAFWKLAAVLAAGRNAFRVWIAGMGARVGGLVLAFVAGSASALSRDGLLLGYGVAILAFLLLEAAWLAHGFSRGRSRGGTEGAGNGRPEPTAGRGDRSTT